MMKKSLFVFGFLLFSPLAFAERPVRGTYTVPMKAGPDGSAPLNSYDVRFHSDTYSESPNTLKFPMPAGLLGTEVWVSFDRDPQVTGRFVGEHGEGHCTNADRFLECTFTFTQLTPDLKAVESFWREQGLDNTVVDQRIAVAAKFGGEPIGVLRYKMRGRDRK